MRLGAHLSIAGGLWMALERAAELGCDTVQLFLTNPRGWKMTGLDDDTVERFRAARRDTGVTPVVAHMPYLPNIGSADPAIYAKSVESLDANLDRCDRLGIEYLVLHMGKSKDAPPEESIERMVAAIDRTYATRDRQVILCIENTAGQGTEVGHDFATIGRIMDRTAAPARLGLCVDTCHAFAAGYDLRTRRALDAVLAEIEREVGLERLYVLHLNDALRERGSRVDRHTHIGQGRLGQAAFRHIVNHPRLRHLPGLLETPQEAEGDVERNLAALRGRPIARSE